MSCHINEEATEVPTWSLLNSIQKRNDTFRAGRQFPVSAEPGGEGALMDLGHYPETGPDWARAPDEAGDPLESKMGRHHRSVNRSFNRPGTPARNRLRQEA